MSYLKTWAQCENNLSKPISKKGAGLEPTALGHEPKMLPITPSQNII